jgi:hypothetical protein
MMSILKFTLEMEEQQYKEKGRQDPRYKFFKKMLMANTYDTLRNLFEDLYELGIVEPTSYEEDLKNGYRDSISGGSGYVNSSDFEDWLNSAPE